MLNSTQTIINLAKQEVGLIKKNLELIEQKINRTCKIYHRNREDISLVTVSKTIETSKIEQAINFGCQIFGENKVIEAKDKWQNLKNQHPNVKLHLIGHLQSNKVKDAVAIFDVIETLDSEKLAQILHKEMIKQNKFPQIFLQINIGQEEQKFGIMPENVNDFIAKVGQYLKISGVMAIPPQGEDPTLYFALLREIAMANNLAKISMGMSGDFEKAIALGANYVRLGSAIFGERNSSTNNNQN